MSKKCDLSLVLNEEREGAVGMLLMQTVDRFQAWYVLSLQTSSQYHHYEWHGLNIVHNRVTIFT